MLALFAPAAQARNVARFATVVDAACAAKENYDFIIAGGGISGLTVADRLTEDPNIKVLVIETDPFDKDDDSVLIPGDFNPATYMWLPLLSTPQIALNNKVFNEPVGKVVGGGSVINGMVYMRSGASGSADWDKNWCYRLDLGQLLALYQEERELHHAPG